MKIQYVLVYFLSFGKSVCSHVYGVAKNYTASLTIADKFPFNSAYIDTFRVILSLLKKHNNKLFVPHFPQIEGINCAKHAFPSVSLGKASS
jgi:hypothetical protein